MPLPATVFTLSLHTPGTWAHWCLSLLQHHAAGDPGQFGGPRCSMTVTRRWLQRVVCPLLDRAWLRRLWRGLALLSNVRFIPGVVRPYKFDRSVYNSSVDSGMARWWGLARHGHDPCPGGRAARHTGDVSSCAFCTSPVGDLTHCLTCCPAFADLRIQWCAAAAHVAPAEASLWTQHSWIFNPQDLANTRCIVRAHIQFVGQVCARVDSCRRGRADL